MHLEDINKCDLYCPNFIISIRDISDDFPWYSWFHSRNLKGMVYAFYYKNELLKIGCSYSAFNTKKNTNYGERLIRQVNNLPGRCKPNEIYIEGYGFVPVSTNGREMVTLIRQFEKYNMVKIDRDQIYLHIWDITTVESTKYFWASDDKGNKQKAKYFEGILVSQYKNDNRNKLPLGNKKQDPTTWNSAFTKPKIAKEAGNLLTFT